MMDKLLVEVTEVISKEYGRASAEYGTTNNSDHESYAVILEELQEAKDDLCCVDATLASFWNFVKNDEPDPMKREILDKLFKHALYTACEFIQVAATVYKATITVDSRERNREASEL